MKEGANSIGRRELFKRGAGLLAGSGLLSACRGERRRKLTVLHTNDMHSHIEPFPSSDPDHPDEGGMAERASLIDAVREEAEHTVLLDAGDIFQGTPYFNAFDGKLELKLMSMMGYDAATMGNHDFDRGTEGFEQVLHHASFPFVTTNYDLSETPLAGKTSKSKVLEREDLRIGILGTGIDLDGLVSPSRTEGVRYLDPIRTAEKEADRLKKDGCDLVIALSHLGFRYESEQVCDEELAKRTKSIDLILGGHTHTFFERPKVYKNLNEHPVIMNQVGWAGLRLGRLDIEWSDRKGLEGLEALNIPVEARFRSKKRIS